MGRSVRSGRITTEDTKVEPVLLRAEEAAALLGIGRSKMYELLAAGVIPSIRIGEKSVRVPRAALLGWIEEHTTNAERDAGSDTGDWARLRGGAGEGCR